MCRDRRFTKLILQIRSFPDRDFAVLWFHFRESRVFSVNLTPTARNSGLVRLLTDSAERLVSPIGSSVGGAGTLHCARLAPMLH